MFLRRLVVVLALVVSLPYLRSPVYHFPAPARFAGPQFLNPYAGLRDTWQRANLHAHGRAWRGLTNGRQSDEQIVRAYTSFGYTVAGVSNYQRIAVSGDGRALPLYEHGYNLGKRHQLAIGARRVTWFDFPLWQSLSHKQFVIDRVADTAELVAIAHPLSRDAYTLEDMRQLTGYQLLEIVNGPFRSEALWDAALSAGHAVWALGNDDTHDLSDQGRTAMAWTMINAPSPAAADIVDALRAGRAYTVSRTNDTASAIETKVGTVRFGDGTLAVSCVGELSTFLFVGQNGVIRKTVKDAMNAAYTFRGDDTYIRTVIKSPRTAMYLNPVLRYDGGPPPAPAATVDIARTWLLRGTIALAGAALFLIWRDRRAPVLAPPQAVLTPADRKTA